MEISHWNVYGKLKIYSELNKKKKLEKYPFVELNALIIIGGFITMEIIFVKFNFLSRFYHYFQAVITRNL